MFLAFAQGAFHPFEAGNVSHRDGQTIQLILSVVGRFNTYEEHLIFSGNGKLTIGCCFVAPGQFQRVIQQRGKPRQENTDFAPDRFIGLQADNRGHCIIDRDVTHLQINETQANRRIGIDSFELEKTLARRLIKAGQVTVNPAIAPEIAVVIKKRNTAGFQNDFSAVRANIAVQ